MKNIKDGGIAKFFLAIALAFLGLSLVDYLTYDRVFLGIATGGFSETTYSSYREKISASDMVAKLFGCAVGMIPILAFFDWIARQ